jgi:pimeloyl-ACP methyl ester carboxylesterase
MGHSMFSILPLEYAISKPDHISYAISSGGVPSFSDMSSRASNEYWDKRASEERKAIRKRNHEELKKMDMSKLTPTEVFIKYYTADTPLRFYDPKYDMSDLWEGVEVNMDFVNHYWKLIYGYGNSDKYHLIKAPVLIFSGRYDFGCPYYLYDGVKDQIPDLTFILFERAGHNPMVEVREEFDKKLIEWMQSH